MVGSMPAEFFSSKFIGHDLEIFTAFFVPLQIICVALRYYSRFLIVGRRLGLDDAIVGVSLVCQMILAGIGISAVKHGGMGYHIGYLEKNHPERVLAWGKYLLAIATFYFFTVNIPKLAILVLYRRVFPQRSVHYIVYGTIGILIGASIANGTASLAACTPFEANYNPTLPGAKCIDKEKLFIWSSIPNLVTDVIMLILPLPIVWGLNNTGRMKMALTFTFLVGSFGLVTSILRFRTFFGKNSFTDGTYNAVDLMIWTETEPGIYLISACLLTFKPLLERLGVTRLGNSLLTARSRQGPSRFGKSARSYPHGSDSKGGIPLKGRRLSSQGFTEIDDTASTAGLADTGGLGNGKITVTTEIQNSWDQK